MLGRNQTLKLKLVNVFSLSFSVTTMVSVLYWIGSLILFFMVPRGRCEPEIMVGHTKVILDNPNYVETHVRDDIINGHLINVCARAHAARVSPKLTEPAGLPVSYEQCSSEWPPWPNFRAMQSSECSAIGAVWSNASKSEVRMIIFRAQSQAQCNTVKDQPILTLMEPQRADSSAKAG